MGAEGHGGTGESLHQKIDGQYERVRSEVYTIFLPPAPLPLCPHAEASEEVPMLWIMRTPKGRANECVYLDPVLSGIPKRCSDARPCGRVYVPT